jgi:hypothetical protein
LPAALRSMGVFRGGGFSLCAFYEPVFLALFSLSHKQLDFLKNNNKGFFVLSFFLS